MKLTYLLTLFILFGAVDAIGQEPRLVDIKTRSGQVAKFKTELFDYLSATVSTARDDISNGRFNDAEAGDMNGYYKLRLRFPKNSKRQRQRDNYAISLVRELNIEANNLANSLLPLTGYRWFSKVTIQDIVAKRYFRVILHLQAREIR